MFRLIFILSLFCVCNAILITKIQNIIIVGNMYNNLLNVTEDQCICEMIEANDGISALNYFSTNQTCQLFRSNSSTIYVEFYLNSTTIFLNQSSMSISILNIQGYQSSTSSSTSTIIPSTSPSTTSSSTSTKTTTRTSSPTSTTASITTSMTTSASNSFLNQSTYSTGVNPFSVAVVDVNSDNQPDIIVANADDNTVSVLLNAGSGTFNVQTTYPVGNYPVSVTVVDVNSDNKSDIVVANAADGTVGVLLNAGSSTFNAQ
ncbi:unnamed protein product, partial [Adineta steineri]